MCESLAHGRHSGKTSYYRLMFSSDLFRSKTGSTWKCMTLWLPCMWSHLLPSLPYLFLKKVFVFTETSFSGSERSGVSRGLLRWEVGRRHSAGRMLGTMARGSGESNGDLQARLFQLVPVCLSGFSPAVVTLLSDG